jgi:hypothetical protein
MKGLAKFARRERIDDRTVTDCVQRASQGLIDADLGGGILKLRVARQGQGRSGGYRKIVAFRIDHRVVFLYGFAKNERENIEPKELLTLRKIGAELMAADDAKIAKALRDDVLEEIRLDEEKTT